MCSRASIFPGPRETIHTRVAGSGRAGRGQIPKLVPQAEPIEASRSFYRKRVERATCVTGWGRSREACSSRSKSEEANVAVPHLLLSQLNSHPAIGAIG